MKTEQSTKMLQARDFNRASKPAYANCTDRPSHRATTARAQHQQQIITSCCIYASTQTLTRKIGPICQCGVFGKRPVQQGPKFWINFVSARNCFAKLDDVCREESAKSVDDSQNE
uniref:(northern house mosquito) hypothetical protein n=1 Tax=Culex pipiens TaxID=7175 RepID=A0A8D8AUF1_CULPI